ncbi:MAG: glycine zipper 2TM domain-containing protein [Rhodoferax sp.]|nr:glycine zipper 2TM domain-containing protein [Rhodoferax sp.]
MSFSTRFTHPIAALELGGLMLALASQALAQGTWSSNPQAVQTQQQARAQFEADKKLCADEASPEARIQCRRDAQALYDKALVSLRSKGVYATQTAPDCATCGKVTAVNLVEKAGESNAVGLIAGGVAGAVLGRQVGGGFGKDLATIAGAAGGAYAGKKVQENMNTKQVWQVSVKYPDGHSATFDFAGDPGLKAGDAVRNSDNTVVRR